jgi:hypothetical protein
MGFKMSGNRDDGGDVLRRLAVETPRMSIEERSPQQQAGRVRLRLRIARAEGRLVSASLTL